ncbi:fungal-specific transcription factor domain-containing protein [Aspergillus venezuelensis]
MAMIPRVVETQEPFDLGIQLRPARNVDDAEQRIECKFTGRDDSRGTAPKSLVMLLQSRIELLEQVLWLHSIDINASIAQLRGAGSSSLGGPRARADRVTTTTCEKTHLSTESDEALCSNEPFDGEGSGEVSYFGCSSGRVELLRSKDVDADEAATKPASTVGSRLNQFCKEIQSTPDISEELEEHLITLYFTWEQPWCQLVDERLFRESMQNKGRYFSPLLLNCILALGSRYSDRLEVRSAPHDSNTAGQMFLDIAEVLLHFDLQYPSITTIQSLGVLAMMYVAIGSDSKGWLRHGMAVRLALDMGFNLEECATLNRLNVLSDAEINLRRQIYWALYCTDKAWASYTGRVCTMLDAQASIQLPLPTETGEEPSQPGKKLVMLHHALATQCQILEKILTSLYAPKRYPLGVQRQTFFDTCLLELKGWKYRLSADLQTRLRGTAKAQTMPQVYILHMVYHTSIIMLAKPFLPQKHKSLPQSSDAPLPCTVEEQRAAILCMEAAREICLLGDQYRKAFGSFRQSPVTATHCTLSAVLFLISTFNHCGRDEDEREEAPSKAIAKLLDSGVVTLGELAESWMPARHYWRAISAIVKERQLFHSVSNNNSGVSCSIGGPIVPCNSTSPDLGAQDTAGYTWGNAQHALDPTGGLFSDGGTWSDAEIYNLLGLEGESFLDGLLLDLPNALDVFTSTSTYPNSEF